MLVLTTLLDDDHLVLDAIQREAHEYVVEDVDTSGLEVVRLLAAGCSNRSSAAGCPARGRR